MKTYAVCLVFECVRLRACECARVCSSGLLDCKGKSSSPAASHDSDLLDYSVRKILIRP